MVVLKSGAGQTCLSLEKLRLDCHCSVSFADLVDVRHALAMIFELASKYPYSRSHALEVLLRLTCLQKI
ncbi:hypothetical protein C5167_040749 [Papaver somniferum]|uniref:Uncharacterized protein n=1 Tax=Papaver somniferum TaxID=3469 RepID=A0A4Y7IK19_PAPSO|nr:hypothetical protein C5167_040749 [Papaver somniferum]